MFAALLIKAEVPILGFSPHLRPIEANICGWYVMNADDATCVVVLCVWRGYYGPHVNLFSLLYNHFGTRNVLTPDFPCFLSSDDTGTSTTIPTRNNGQGRGPQPRHLLPLGCRWHRVREVLQHGSDTAKEPTKESRP